MSDYAIRKLDPGEFDMLVPLMKDCFSMDVDIEYFKWKFLGYPSGSFVGFIAVHEATGEVAAYYGAIPELYEVDGKTKLVYQSCDTMTHSRHRRKGLFQKLAIHCYDYLRAQDRLFIIGFGGDQSTPGFIKFGWIKLFDFRYLFIPKILCYFRGPVPKGKISETPDFAAQSALAGARLAGPVHSTRTADILKWRYANPRVSYRFALYGDKAIEGYVVYYREQNKIILFDFVFSSTRSRRGLVRWLKKKTADEGMKGIVAFCQEGGQTDRQLRAAGFIGNPFKKGPLSSRAHFIFYSDPETMAKYKDPAQWSIDSFDHDSY